MSPVNPIGTPSQIGATPSPANQSGALGKAGALGKEDFLRLLVTQLRYQDPLKPMEDREFITQLAQFSSLEQMQEMNRGIEGFSASQDVMVAASLLGRVVEYQDLLQTPDAPGRVRAGIVGRVSWATGVPTLTIDDKEVYLFQIVAVR